MTTNIEIEAKSMLSEDSYKVLMLSHENEAYVQVNYYIDNIKFKVSKKHLGLRIRLKNDKYELTTKVKLEEGKLEVNQVLSKAEFMAFKDEHIFPSGDIESILRSKEINPDKLFIFAELKTTRFDLNYKGSLISIDKNEYNGLIDYEIECEDKTMASAKKNLKEFLAIKKIPYQENLVTKLKRAMNSL